MILFIVILFLRQKAFDVARIEIAVPEVLVVHDLDVERNGGFQGFDGVFSQAALHHIDGFITGQGEGDRQGARRPLHRPAR